MPPQDIITRDNVTLKVNAVIFLRVIDPNKAVVEVSNYVYQTSQFAQTTLRSVLGEQELDELLAHREKINLRLQSILDTHTAPWGVKVANVEVKQVDMPESMLRAMAQTGRSGTRKALQDHPRGRRVLRRAAPGRCREAPRHRTRQRATALPADAHRDRRGEEHDRRLPGSGRFLLRDPENPRRNAGGDQGRLKARANSYAYCATRYRNYPRHGPDAGSVFRAGPGLCRFLCYRLFAWTQGGSRRPRQRAGGTESKSRNRCSSYRRQEQSAANTDFERFQLLQSRRAKDRRRTAPNQRNAGASRRHCAARRCQEPRFRHPHASFQPMPTTSRSRPCTRPEDADALVEALKKKQYPAFIAGNVAGDKFYRVQVGPFTDIKDAELMRGRLTGDGYNPILKR